MRAGAAGVAAAVVLAAGCAGGATEPCAPAVTQAAAVPAAAQVPAQVSSPVRVRVPAIGVDAGVIPLDVDGQGVLPPPATDGEAGWWRAGPEPGERDRP
jgi:hypothetical protein